MPTKYFCFKCKEFKEEMDMTRKDLCKQCWGCKDTKWSVARTANKKKGGLKINDV